MRADRSPLPGRPVIRRIALLGALSLAGLGCNRTIPPHLAIDDASRRPAAPLDLSSRDAALQGSLRGDPLARAPRLPAANTLDEVPDAEGLAAAARLLGQLERNRGDMVSGLQAAEASHRGKDGVALLRGARFQLVEQTLAVHQDNLRAPEVIVLASLLSPLRPDRDANAYGRHPLDGLAGAMPFASAIRRYGERWVLQAWLDAPSASVTPVAAVLDTATWDALRSRPAGRLILARAAGTEPDRDAIDRALHDLQVATALGLERAAADTDAEQAAWNTRRAALADELGTKDPVRFHLVRAREAFIGNAADDRAVAGALLTMAADRLTAGCDDAPCAGLDRTDLMAVAAAWSPELAPYASAWQVIALKSALDGLVVGRETIRFGAATLDMVDALLGTRAAPPPAGLLSRRRPDPGAWRALGEMVGVPKAATWDDVRPALGEHVAQHARSSSAKLPIDLKPLLERIARRASP